MSSRSQDKSEPSRHPRDLLEIAHHYLDSALDETDQIEKNYHIRMGLQALVMYKEQFTQ